MNAIDVKIKCSIRGRVAFVLAIAEKCLGLLQYSEKVYNIAAKALEDAWKWEEGRKVHGDQLDYYLENPEEESLAVYGCDPPKPSWAAIMAITSALAFVTWHAYKKDGIKRMSSTIHEVSESVVDDVVGYATQSAGCDPAFLECISKYIVEKCGSSDVSELGKPMKREAVLGACTNSMKS
ncbi:MAG: hypothetical protein HY040_16335 [Planctomycetes bacterium]|nr:hypothetical protein [Planctomycetota bacterium]